MNYLAHYERLIARGKTRTPTGYSERHHIVPRCMGGSNKKDNIVRLTGEEHYIAHQLLVKIHPSVSHLASAAVFMAIRCSNNKAYGWLRRRSAKATSASMMGNKSWLGKTHTEEWKEARRKEMLGKKMPRAGVEKLAASKRCRPLSAEHRAKISAANRGKVRSPEQRAKYAASHIGLKISPAAGAKIGEANRKRVFTAQMRANMSASRRGKKRGPYTMMEVTAEQAVSLNGPVVTVSH